MSHSARRYLVVYLVIIWWWAWRGTVLFIIWWEGRSDVCWEGRGDLVVICRWAGNRARRHTVLDVVRWWWGGTCAWRHTALVVRLMGAVKRSEPVVV